MWNEPNKEKLDQIPRLYETEKIPLKEKLVHLHFFIFQTDFYICEYDGKDKFWGFVILNNDLEMAEWGYINFAELKSINIAGFEVDCELEEFWEVRPAKTIQRICKAQNWQFSPYEDNKGGSHGVHTRT